MKKYKIRYQNIDKIEEIIIETTNLSSEKLPKNIIEIIEYKTNYKFDYKRKKRINNKDLNLLFYEFNLMLQANINISDALDILIKNKKDKNMVDFLKTIKYSLSKGKSIDENLNTFKINSLVISFLKISQDSGNIALNMRALNELLIQSEEIKKSFYKAISYPIILTITLMISLFTIFSFVVPKFKVIFSQTQNELPMATKILLSSESFFENYFLYLLSLIILLILFFSNLYIKNSRFEYFVDKFLINNFILVKDIYLNMELYKLFLLIDIMLKSNYEFHKAFISSKILLKNKYLLDKIYIIDNLLQNGKSINDSFLKTKIFDDIVLNLINTGEVSNSLGITIDEIKKIYKNRFNDKMNLLTSLIQPIFLLIIMGLILWIVLAIFMPIWNMGNMINI
ncbi:type II secretion system F family protein [Arcobacter cloacae]|uniref:Transformation system protein n=1 Tax=Arcobacter cloacae TaxID=1054034 RepID=A0A4Q0ZCQ9_9BACT|nr:type II secretion system F family protein [Arcobacter cloacae]RXJ84094.1 transformation system protein [Arcobacter cloacae]